VAKSGATAHTTTALLSRDATAASHAVEKRSMTMSKTADAAMPFDHMRSTDAKPHHWSSSPTDCIKSSLPRSTSCRSTWRLKSSPGMSAARKNAAARYGNLIYIVSTMSRAMGLQARALHEETPQKVPRIRLRTPEPRGIWRKRTRDRRRLRGRLSRICRPWKPELALRGRQTPPFPRKATRSGTNGPERPLPTRPAATSGKRASARSARLMNCLARYALRRLARVERLARGVQALHPRVRVRGVTRQ